MNNNKEKSTLIECHSVEECVKKNLSIYFAELEGQIPTNVFELVVSQAEKAAILFILEKCNHNQTQSAKMLGISRNSLRLRMQKYNIN